MINETATKFDDLLSTAFDLGATGAKMLPAHQIVLDERVRLKCEVPLCSGYGQYLTCPPYVMSMETFSRILARWKGRHSSKGCDLLQVSWVGVVSSVMNA
jgi:predicted metal-binding protein